MGGWPMTQPPAFAQNLAEARAARRRASLPPAAAGHGLVPLAPGGVHGVSLARPLPDKSAHAQEVLIVSQRADSTQRGMSAGCRGEGTPARPDRRDLWARRGYPPRS